MASFTHVDSRVAERRLRPIYDWLDVGNNKKALQEAEKVLKKQPNLSCAKVLKALALQRLGREAECEKILEGVCGEVPTDEATLQAITICYRAIHKPNKICDVYAAASKKDPNNEELLTHLFMSYVRIGDYRKQHQHAMSLYKLRPKNPYYFWAVMSVVMQAKGDKMMERTVALKLAEKMVSKFVTEGKMEAEQEVQLYLMILEMQGKFEEALDVIEGELGEKLKSLITTSVKRIELLMRLQRWKEANVLLKCQLEKNFDSWSDYKSYLETVMKLHADYQKEEKNENGKEEFDNRVPVPSDGGESIVWHKADYTPEMAHLFLLQLIKQMEDEKKKFRGPYLAQLELFKLLHDLSQDAQSVVGNIEDLLGNYFEKFADKAICVSDAKPYFYLLTDDSRKTLMNRINDAVGYADGDAPEALSSLQRLISKFQFSRTLGCHSSLTVEERLILSDLLLINHRLCQKLVSPNKLPTEFSCNDPFIILQAHVLYSMFKDTKSSDHIIKAIYYLESSLTASPSNFHFKLLLVKFYLLLGAGQQAFHFYEQLEVKHIQLDSTGYIIGTSIYGLGNFSVAAFLYDTTLKFFITNTNDSVDDLTYAYKYGSFMKIEEFIEFRDRLNESLYYTFCTVEKMLHDVLTTSDHSQSELLIKNMEIRPDIDKINWSALRDNRDLSVILSYEPGEDQLNDRTIKKTFENLKNYVRLRVVTLKCLSAVFDFINDDTSERNRKTNKECIQNGDYESAKSVLVRLLSELKCLYDELNSQDLDIDIQDVINSPPPCRLKTYLKIPMYLIINNMCSIIQSEDNSNSLEQMSSSISETISCSVKSCIARINNDILQRREILETIVGTIEMLSITIILCGALKSAEVKSRKNMRKGRKKKEDGDGCSDSQNCKTILKDVSDCIRDLCQALTQAIDENTVEDVSSEVQALNIVDETNDTDYFSVIKGKLKGSYYTSLQEMKHLLQEKQAYISTIKS